MARELAVAAAVPLVLCLLRPGLLVSVVLFAVSGGIGTIVVLQATTSFTVALPDSSRGQVLGLSNAGLTTASGLSPLAAGVVADHMGAATTVGWFGLGCLVLAVPLAVTWWRATRYDPQRWIAWAGDDGAPRRPQHP